jgi:hypothetical protein
VILKHTKVCLAAVDTGFPKFDKQSEIDRKKSKGQIKYSYGIDHTNIPDANSRRYNGALAQQESKVSR